MPNLTQFKTHKDYIHWYRAYRAKNREKIRKYTREYNTEYRKAHKYKYEIKYYKENQEKIKAHYKARVAYPIKKPCETCNSKGAVMHHPDYSFPLYVIWLCPKHHSWIHSVFTTKEMKDVTKEQHIKILKKMDVLMHTNHIDIGAWR